MNKLYYCSSESTTMDPNYRYITNAPVYNIGKKKGGGVGGGRNGLTGKLVGITDEDQQLSDGTKFYFHYSFQMMDR